MSASHGPPARWCCSARGHATGMAPTKVLVGTRRQVFDTLYRTVDPVRFEIVAANLATAPLAGHDAVLPLSLEDHAALTARRAAGERVSALLPSVEAVALCDDKLALNRRLIAAGLGALVPPLLPADAPPPFILKRRRDIAGQNSHIVTTPEQVAGLRDRVGDQWFRQALVHGGTEHALHVLMQDGQPIFHAMVSYRLAGSVFVKGIHFKPEGHSWSAGGHELALLLPVLQVAGFSDGLCCIDFKLVDGRPQLFEVNPRYGISIGLRPMAMLAAYCSAVRQLQVS